MAGGSLVARLKALSVGTKVSLGVIAAIVVVGATHQPHRSTPPAAASAQSTQPPLAAVVTTERVTKTVLIPFKKTTVKDGSLAKGQTRVTTKGVQGKKTVTYEVTLKDGAESERQKISEVVTVKPVDEVTAVGTFVYVAPKPKPQPASSSCDPNYAGACVPIASDVDCAGGSGNGPAYVTGPVQVVGTDIYGLDRDGDGWGCE